MSPWAVVSVLYNEINNFIKTIQCGYYLALTLFLWRILLGMLASIDKVPAASCSYIPDSPSTMPCDADILLYKGLRIILNLAL